jgi:phosphopantothenoylcysteine decarboxylase / phosphopantothenate---cysteine ligase
LARIVLGITGGIAAYKTADIVRALVKKGVEVVCIMTEAAREFVTPLTLRTLSNNPVYCDMFHDAKDPGGPVEHIDLARNCDLILIAPATANVIGKIACGIADDLLTTTVMACEKKVMLAPAMNKAMWENPVVKENTAKLKKLGYIFLGPKEGDLACGEYGSGHIEDIDVIINAVLAGLKKKTLNNKTVLIMSGPTREHIDDVRFISNPSSGKTGYFLAGEAKARGAKVIFITGRTSYMPDADITEKVLSASDMLDRALLHSKKADIIIGAAAVGDFTVKKAKGKISRETRNKELRGKTRNSELGTRNLKLELIPTIDIMAEIGKAKGKKFLVGFSAETGPAVERTKQKIRYKNLDMAIFNDISKKDAGFESDTNEIIIIDRRGKEIYKGRDTKENLASVILDKIEGYIT